MASTRRDCSSDRFVTLSVNSHMFSWMYIEMILLFILIIDTFSSDTSGNAPVCILYLYLGTSLWLEVSYWHLGGYVNTLAKITLAVAILLRMINHAPSSILCTLSSPSNFTGHIYPTPVHAKWITTALSRSSLNHRYRRLLLSWRCVINWRSVNWVHLHDFEVHCVTSVVQHHLVIHLLNTVTMNQLNWVHEITMSNGLIHLEHQLNQVSVIQMHHRMHQSIH